MSGPQTTDPSASDDSSLGYSIGSTWVNTTDDNAFVCTDASTGAAVWKQVTPRTYALMVDKTANQTVTDGVPTVVTNYNTPRYALGGAASDWDGTTGILTIPEDGLYFCSGYIEVNPPVTTTAGGFVAAFTPAIGASVLLVARTWVQVSPPPATMNSGVFSGYLNLSAGDTVSLVSYNVGGDMPVDQAMLNVVRLQ